MAALVQAGIDYRPYLRATDDVERIVDEVIAERVLDVVSRNTEQRIQNHANMVGNRVGQIVGRAMQSIAQAMRG